MIITSVNPGGPAGLAKPAMHGGDVIMAVGETPVGNVADLRKASKAVVGESDEPVPHGHPVLA